MTPRRMLPPLLLGLAAALRGILPAQAQSAAQNAAPGQAPASSDPAGELALVERKNFEIAGFTTRGGATVGRMRIGYQTAGTLNAAGGNAVLITHPFVANGQAFGRNDANGPLGWWDAIIGPGKPIDTNRFFVVASDTPANLYVRESRTTSTGPASVDPSTGRPYGMSFPVLSIRDFVEVQKGLLDSLGVKRLALVAGPSMGAMQAIEWAAAYPALVDRVMPVMPVSRMDAWLQAWMEIWEAPIRADPNWRNGDYYVQGREPPLRGLTDALRIIALQTQDRAALSRFDGRAAEGQDPARRMTDTVAVDPYLTEIATGRAKLADANSFLYLTRAMQLFLNEYPDTRAALSQGKASWLLVPGERDRLFPIEYARELEGVLKGLGRPVRLEALDGPQGHGEWLTGIAGAEEAIRAFLAEAPRAP